MFAGLYAIEWELLELERKRIEAMSPEERAEYTRKRKRNRLSRKDERMKRRLARHRAAIWKRRWGISGAAFLAMAALPLALIIVCSLWRWALKSIVE